ncbi:hypothetical protein M1O54_00175 [Dehalococcoidia bacterium]|nr:hypothetical protein [Dehalococcoidia bacterium]
MEEFRREWEPKGWRLIIIGPTSTWRQEWGMWEAIRDIVQNSCPHDMPLLILQNQRVKFVPIGEFVEMHLEDERQGTVKDEVYALSFKNHKSRGYKLRWQRIHKVYRHHYQGDMVEVSLTNGLKVRVTCGHSLFRRDLKKGRMWLCSVPTDRLHKTDYIAIPFAKLLDFPAADEVDLLEFLEQEKDSLRVRGMCDTLESVGVEVSKDGRSRDSIPLWTIPVPLPKDTLLGYHHASHPVRRTLPLEPLAYLLGLYLAEGSIVNHRKKGDKAVCFSLGTHEHEVLEKVKRCAEQIGVGVSVQHPHETAINTVLKCHVLALVFERLFGKTRANTKAIPDFIFNLPHKFQTKFLEGYFDGDGYDQGDRIIITTASKKIAQGLQYLLLLNGIPFSIEEQEGKERVIGKNRTFSGPANYLYIRKSGLNGNVSKSPIARQRCGDLSFVGVKEIKPVEYKHPWVYDIGVPGCENFVGGESPVILHNSLDEAEKYTWGFDEEGLWIKDRGQGVQVADFLLGPPRTKPPHARGRFGEGMKIAALVMLREGYAIRIDTVGRSVWMIFLEQEINGTAEVLAAMWRPNGLDRGTRFHIIGYFGDDYKWNFAVNIPRKFIAHEGPSRLHEPIRRFNQLILSPSGKIYARDIYMRDIKSPYSYNLWSFEMAPDRHGPKHESDMWVDMGRLWATCKRKEPLQVLLRMVSMPPVLATDESVNLSMSPWDMGPEPVSGKRYTEIMEDNKKVWQDAWKEAHGENAVLRQSDRWDTMVTHLGYKSVSVFYGVTDALSKVILTDEALIRDSQKRLAEVEIIPDEELTERQRAHLRLARKIAEATLVRELTGVHAAIIPPASDRMRTAGLYSSAAETIYIAADQLNTARATVDVLIHEMAHHTSGREDGDPLHNAQMTVLGSRVVQLTAEGRFDEELKKAVWY